MLAFNPTSARAPSAGSHRHERWADPLPLLRVAAQESTGRGTVFADCTSTGAAIPRPRAVADALSSGPLPSEVAVFRWGGGSIST